MSLIGELEKDDKGDSEGGYSGRREFAAVQADVEEAISKGFSLISIWRHLYDKGVISFKYPQFTKHVRNQITKKDSGKSEKKKESKPNKATEPEVKAGSDEEKKSFKNAFSSMAEPKAVEHENKPDLDDLMKGID